MGCGPPEEMKVHVILSEAKDLQFGRGASESRIPKLNKNLDALSS
jgi:hypothetical protein